MVRPYLGARNLARLKAGGANVHLATVTIDDDVDALDVGAEGAVGHTVGVADVATSGGVLTTDRANLRHCYRSPCFNKRLDEQLEPSITLG